MIAEPRFIRKTLQVLGLLTSLSLASACQQATAPRSDEVTFAVVIPDGASEAESAWRAYLKDMGDLTGLKIKPNFTADDDASVKAMHNNRVQTGLFSNTAALNAVRDASAYVIARASDPTAPDGYRSLIVTRADSGLSLAHLMACSGGLRFGMGAEASLAGNHAPLTYLFLPEKADPNTCFATVSRSEPTNQINALMTGKLDATISNSIALQRFTAAAPKEAARLKVIWSSPLLADPPLLLRKDLDPATREKLRSFILSYGTGDGPEADRQRSVLGRLGLSAFQPADDSHLLPMREMEAAQKLIAARKGTDPAALAQAEEDFETIAAQRRTLAKPVEAPADPL